MSVPYRAPPSLANSTDRWGGARVGLLLIAVASVGRAIACFLEWVGMRTDVLCLTGADVTLPRFGLTSGAMFTYAAVGSVTSIGVLAFRRSLLLRSSRGLSLASAALLGFAAVAGVALDLRRMIGAPVPDWLLTSVTSTSTLGTLGFVASAWHVEHAVRARATGWTWALASAVVVTIAAWQLRASLGPASLGSYARYVRVSPYSTLMTFALAAASLVLVAIACLRLRRSLVGAVREEPPVLPGFMRTLQVHAASLEGKLALMIGLAIIECCGRAPWVDIHVGWGSMFAVGDVALDGLALATMFRFARDTPAPRWLVASIILRLPLLLLLAGRWTWAPALSLALASNLFALAGHHKFVRWLVGKLEPYCLGRTQDAYREATTSVVGALVAFTVVAYVVQSTDLFVVVAAATVIVSVGLLRRHVRAALAAIAEGEATSARAPTI